MSIAVVFDGFILYMEFNMEMCVEISDKIWRLHALFSVTDVTLNWAAVNFIKSAFHPELYGPSSSTRAYYFRSESLLIGCYCSHFTWLCLNFIKTKRNGPFFLRLYIFASHFSDAQQQCFRYVIFWGNVNICIHQYLSREKKIYPIWLSVVCCYTIHFFPSIISCSRFIFNNRISMPYNFPCILFFFSQYLNKKEIVIDISIFFSAHFLAYEGSIAFSTIYFFKFDILCPVQQKKWFSYSRSVHWTKTIQLKFG